MIWKLNAISFSKAIAEINLNFGVVDNVISDKHVKSFNKKEYKPKTAQSQLTNIVFYDFETFNTDRAVPYAKCIYRLSKFSGTY